MELGEVKVQEEVQGGVEEEAQEEVEEVQSAGAGGGALTCFMNSISRGLRPWPEGATK